MCALIDPNQHLVYDCHPLMGRVGNSSRSLVSRVSIWLALSIVSVEKMEIEHVQHIQYVLPKNHHSSAFSQNFPIHLKCINKRSSYFSLMLWVLTGELRICLKQRGGASETGNLHAKSVKLEWTSNMLLINAWRLVPNTSTGKGAGNIRRSAAGSWNWLMELGINLGSRQRQTQQPIFKKKCFLSIFNWIF